MMTSHNRTYNRRERTRLFPPNGDGYTSLDQVKWFFKDSPIPRWSDPLEQLIPASEHIDMDKIVLNHDRRPVESSVSEDESSVAQRTRGKPLARPIEDLMRLDGSEKAIPSPPPAKSDSPVSPAKKEVTKRRLSSRASPLKLNGGKNKRGPKSPSKVTPEAVADNSSSSEDDNDDNKGSDDDSEKESVISHEVIKPKKSYLTQGAYYGIMRRGRLSKGVRDNHVFPLPMLDGLKRMNTEKPFQLPWNIYCPSEDGPKAKWRTLKKSK
ncbi:hypothetical protein AWJ20_56 [Sugiyamaella lignohabitans]|uniref:Uncharacterized protein n=1 Tax=Sugiyamaella lignohabitans TaxID=796027 RepID=A0A167CKZ4_9ASCO|nr:uncharacterized protein AWJ20_56 [Sugiyamaella lignohabitans]ANB11832.1 hypothetical protein AWJ20_56 [Sugiyamaella lignohabitans]